MGFTPGVQCRDSRQRFVRLMLADSHITRHFAVDLDLILGIGAFSLASLLESDPNFLGTAEEPKTHPRDHSHGDHAQGDHDDKSGGAVNSHKAHADAHATDKGHHHHHKHDDTVSSVGFEMAGSCKPREVQEWLQTLLQKQGNDIFRSKGVLAMQGSQERYVEGRGSRAGGFRFREWKG